jgi:inhibitor of KinA sporulation pathway (predicted exonuclease)
MIAPVLVIDLEATCADDDSLPAQLMEVLEVGAVWVTPEGQILDRFQSFVRPIERPQLTAFCKRLLPHIDQAAIDAAPTWPAIAARLAEFAQRHQQPGSWWGSWGAFDHNQIERESARHGIADPLALPHQNLKKAFAKARKIKQVGMATALQIAGLTPEGDHHRALDDALNIARLLPFCPRPDPAARG